jgi:type II restriction enzyme
MFFINLPLIVRFRTTIQMRDFVTWFSRFHDKIANYTYYIDFSKIYKKVDSIKIEINILNSLIGSKDIETEFEQIVAEYPKTLRCIPLLLAVRQNEIYANDIDGEFNYSFSDFNCSIEQYKIFMRKTGLFDLLKNHIISNLLDYVTGVETGLDSNGRKNRGGILMEEFIEERLIYHGFIKNKTYFKGLTISKIEQLWNLNLTPLSNLGKTVKRFDFVVNKSKIVYGIEVNFYASKGSKLNETARSYKTLALESKAISGFQFVWFTDGQGWNSSRHNLEETFDIMEHIYCIADINDGVMTRIFK